MKKIQCSALLFAATLAFGCGSDDPAESPDAGITADASPSPDGTEEVFIETQGTWESQFGGLFTISNLAWNGATLISFDNDSNEAITQLPATDLFNPNKFTKEVWTEVADGSFYLCTVSFGNETAQDAIDAANTADASDPENSGCGGFAWTRLFTPIETYGVWANPTFKYQEDIVTANWSGSAIVEFDNEENYAITQAPSDDNSGLFSRLEWTEIDAQQFYYCTVAFNQATAEDAKNTTKTADASDPENSGCGNFAWTKLVPAIELNGEWDTQFKGFTETISSFAWSGATVIRYDNETNVAITQNPEDAQFGPLKFSKLVWTDLVNNSAYYCTVAFNQDTLEDAETTT